MLNDEQLLLLNSKKVVPLLKDNGGFRTICVGSGLARLFYGVVSKIITACAQEVLDAENQTLRKHGSAVLALSAQLTYDRDGTIDGQDTSNAFNCMDVKDVVAQFEALGKSNVAKLAQYDARHTVVHQEGSFQAENIPQGAPAGTAYAAVLVEACVAPVRNANPTSAIVPYSDDVNCLDASEERAGVASLECQAALEQKGLHTNSTKRLVLNKTKEVTAKIGGAYIGKEASASVDAKGEEIARKAEELASLVHGAGVTGDALVQAATWGLSKCLGPAADSVMRLHRVDQTERAAKRVDQAVVEAFRVIDRFSVEEAEFVRPQLFLPRREGGLGFVEHEKTRFFDRIGLIATCLVQVIPIMDKVFPERQASTVFDEVDMLIAHCRDVLQLQEADDLWKDLELLRVVNDREQVPTAKIARKLDGIGPRTRYAYWKAQGKAWARTFEGANLAIRERLASMRSKKYAGRVNGVALKKMRVNWMADGPWIAQQRLNCLLPAVPVGTGPCKCCGRDIDDFGEHFLRCSASGQGPAHYAVQSALVASIKEVVKGRNVQVTPTPSLEEYMKPEASLARAGQRQQKAERPQADIKVCDIDNRTTTLFDVRTCTMRVPKTLAEVGQTVVLGEKAKNDQYAALYTFPQGVDFVPFAIDTHGRIGEQGIKAIKKICLSTTGGIRDAMYAKRLSMVIDRVAVAHKRAIGRRILLGISKCVDKSNDTRWGTREYQFVR
jgi:hypothetical protein